LREHIDQPVRARSIHQKRAIIFYPSLMARPKLYEEKRIPTAVRIPESLHRQLQAAAEEREISVNLIIVRAIKKHLEQLPSVDEIPTDKSA
jgi:hypothetical protein